MRRPEDCPHRRESVVTEEYYEPLFGDTPIASIAYRVCDDCGTELGKVADASVIHADPATASLYGEPAV